MLIAVSIQRKPMEQEKKRVTVLRHLFSQISQKSVVPGLMWR